MSNAPRVSNKFISTAGVLKNKNNQMVPLRKKVNSCLFVICLIFLTFTMLCDPDVT